MSRPRSCQIQIQIQIHLSRNDSRLSEGVLYIVLLCIFLFLSTIYPPKETLMKPFNDWCQHQGQFVSCVPICAPESKELVTDRRHNTLNNGCLVCVCHAIVLYIHEWSSNVLRPSLHFTETHVFRGHRLVFVFAVLEAELYICRVYVQKAWLIVMCSNSKG